MIFDFIGDVIMDTIVLGIRTLYRKIRHPKGYRLGVGIMLINEEGKVFVGQRIDFPVNEKGQEAWQMPQGGIDADESPKDALWRELYEEIGLQRKDVKLLASSKGWLSYDLPKGLKGNYWEGKYKGQRQKWYLLKLLSGDDAIHIQGKGGEPAEFSQWKWIYPEHLPLLIVDFKRGMYEKAVEGFRDKFINVSYGLDL